MGIPCYLPDAFPLQTVIGVREIGYLTDSIGRLKAHDIPLWLTVLF